MAIKLSGYIVSGWEWICDIPRMRVRRVSGKSYKDPVQKTSPNFNKDQFITGFVVLHITNISYARIVWYREVRYVHLNPSDNDNIW
jgi:hypothetical protein